MLIVMKTNATEREMATVTELVTSLGLRAHSVPGLLRTAIGITGNQGAVDATHFENLAGVAEVIRVTKPYKLITLDLKPEKTIVRCGDATIGAGNLTIIAGPCAVENREQTITIAETVRRSGAKFSK